MSKVRAACRSLITDRQRDLLSSVLGVMGTLLARDTHAHPQEKPGSYPGL